MGIFLDKLTKKMNDGKIVCGVCVALNDPAVSELVGMAGYDFVWIEGDAGPDDRCPRRRRSSHDPSTLP